jgi:SlyX protein
MAIDTRVEELEIRVAFQDDLLTSLNAEVHSAHQAIARLRAELESLRASIDGLKGGLREQPGEEPPPPHY